MNDQNNPPQPPTPPPIPPQNPQVPPTPPMPPQGVGQPQPPMMGAQPAVQPYSQAAKSNGSDSSKKIIIIILSVLFALIFIGSAVFSIIYLTKDDSPDDTITTTSYTYDDTSTTEKAVTKKDIRRYDINESMYDIDADVNVKALRAIVNVPLKSTYDNGKVGVLVEVKIENNSKYYYSVHSTDFKLLGDSGSSSYESDYNLESYIDDEGLTMLSDNSVAEGDSATVWVAFSIDKNDTDSLKLEFNRVKFRDTATDEYYPAFEDTVTIK